MALRSLVQSQVAAALRAIQDLGEDITISKVSSEEYSFSTNAISRDSTAAAINSTCVVLSTRRSTQDGTPHLEAAIIVDSTVVGSIDGYDGVTLRGADWQIVSYEDNEYTNQIELRRAL